jgi:hypothetical protein
LFEVKIEVWGTQLGIPLFGGGGGGGDCRLVASNVFFLSQFCDVTKVVIIHKTM